MDFHINKFPNHLRSLVVHDKDSSTVSIMILVRVGSRFEDPKVGGIAHFVEHTIFKGTKLRPSSKIISMEIESLGAKMNAFTAYDYTGYYIKAPKESFEKAIDVLADIFQNPLFDENEIEKERGVILEEKRMYEDKPMDKVMEVFMANLFKKHSLGREVIGSEKSIKAIKKQDFFNFLHEHYGGRNTIVVVAGGIDKSRANEKISDLFAELKEKKYSRFPVFKKKLISRKRVNVNKPIAQSHLIIGGYGIKRKSKDRFLAQVANALLGSGFGSKLFQTIRDELGLAYYVYSGLMKFHETGAYYVGLGVENSKVNEAVRAVLAQMANVSNGEFSDQELDRAKNWLIGGLTVGLETSNDLAVWYGTQLLLNEEVLSIEEVKRRIGTISARDVAKFCKNMFQRDNVLVAGVTPHKKLEVNLEIK